MGFGVTSQLGLGPHVSRVWGHISVGFGATSQCGLGVHLSRVWGHISVGFGAIAQWGLGLHLSGVWGRISVGFGAIAQWGLGLHLSGVWGHISVGFGATVLTRCAGDGERLSFSVAPAGTSSSGHFICRYCQSKGLSAQHPTPPKPQTPTAGSPEDAPNPWGRWHVGVPLLSPISPNCPIKVDFGDAILSHTAPDQRAKPECEKPPQTQ